MNILHTCPPHLSDVDDEKNTDKATDIFHGDMRLTNVTFSRHYAKAAEVNWNAVLKTSINCHR